MTDETLSWRAIKPGWRVLARDGSALGTVHEVIAAEREDIFRGVRIRVGLLSGEIEALSDHIERISDGEVHTSLDPEGHPPA